ncbi:MAG: hypothetical protein QOI36_1161, partial [Pseudonocardiales bacterium]|nr:hypothetical protein [Pseudonocardiales bacterium]
AHVAKHVATGRVFVPCRDGVSHSPAEHAEAARVAEAVDVLVEAFRSIDAGEHA